MSSAHEFTLGRDCQVIQIPSGLTCRLAEGTKGIVTQSRGGWHTVSTEKGLFRVEGQDADALGLEHSETEAFKAEDLGEDFDIEKAVWKQLKSVYDPEVPVNVVDLGLVYECDIAPFEQGTYRVEVKLGLTAPGCGMADVMVADARERLLAIPVVKRARVDLTLDPPWDRSMMSEVALLELGMY